MFIFCNLNSHTSAGIADLKTVLDKLRAVPKEKWQELGLKLGLYQPTLNNIEYNKGRDVEACFRQCLSDWLSKKDNVEDTTWNTLADALEEIEGRAASEAIRSKIVVYIYIDLLMLFNSFTYKIKISCRYTI